MSLFYFKMKSTLSKGHLFVAVLSLATILPSCAPKISREGDDRTYLEPFRKSVGIVEESEALGAMNELEQVSASETACGFLNSLPVDAEPWQNFRLLDDVAVLESARLNGRRSSEGESACHRLARRGRPSSERERQELERLWKLCREYNATPAGAIDLKTALARVDVSQSPLYNLALSTPDVPDRARFIELVEQELNKTPLDLTDKIVPRKHQFLRTILFPILLPIMALDWIIPDRVFKTVALNMALQLGMIDPIAERNRIVRERMEAAFPGAFETGPGFGKLTNSIPEVIARNGTPELSRFELTGDESPADAKLKNARRAEILKHYTRPVALFRAGGWASFNDDNRRGLALAIRGFSSRNADEQACGTILLHRSFAQMLSIMGHNRIPVERTANRERANVVPVEKLLGKRDGTVIQTCAEPGSFAKQGLAQLLDRDSLGAYDSRLAAESPLDLARTPRRLNDCTLDRALGQVSESSQIEDTARSEELIDFLSGSVHTLLALNPRANWWRDSQWPLSKFEDLQQILSSEGFMPFEAHALALAYVNIGFTNLAERHIVYIGADGRELTSAQGARGIRISDLPHVRGNGGRIRTSISSVVTLTQLVHKLDYAFELVDRLQEDFKNSLEEAHADSSAEGRRAEKELQKNIEDITVGMFGSAASMAKVADAGPGSARAQMQDLKMALGLLLTSFAEKDSDGVVQCVSALEKDLSIGDDSKVGRCTTAEKAEWKRALILSGKYMKSPLLMDLAK